MSFIGPTNKPFGFVPRTQQFTVGGIFKIGMIQFDAGLILANLGDVQQYLGLRDRVEAIEVRVADPANVNMLVPDLQKISERVTGDPLAFSVTTWQGANMDFFRALQVERVTMFLILSLIIVVASFNIITGQMMLVSDKMADIAILRTMGATKQQILKVFFLNGMLLGGLGTVAGIGLGMVAVWNMQALVNGVQALTGVNLFPGDVYFLSELPARVNWADVGSIVAVALILTMLASIYPAWKASRLDPVRLLKQG